MFGEHRDLLADRQYHTAGGTRVVPLDLLADRAQVGERRASPSQTPH
jgi:hypothetical protein